MNRNSQFNVKELLSIFINKIAKNESSGQLEIILITIATSV
ncbi:hypothetical protein IFVP18_C170130 [Vibrio parahaemolyticus]